MLNQKDRLDRFADVINKTATEQVRVIEKQTLLIEKKQLEALEKQTSRENQASLEYEIKKIRDEINRKAALLKQESKKARIAHRQEIEDKVFLSVKQSISLFTEGEAYETFLKNSLEGILLSLGRDAEIFTREKDYAFVNSLIFERGNTASVSVDSENLLGGLIGESADGLMRIDDSLSSRLEAQRQWFRENSGLKV